VKLLVPILLLIATSAAAQPRVGLIGDSHVRGGVTFVGVGGEAFVSRWRMAVTLQALLDSSGGGTVVDLSIPGTGVGDDLLPPGPGAAAHCVGVDDPWCCCTGAGTGAGCICDGSIPDYYPHLKAACRDRRPLTEYLPTDIDIWVLQADGSQCSSDPADVEKLVDQVEDLRDALSALGGTVMVTPPSPVTGQCVALSATHTAVHTEMDSRGIITGPDFFDYPASRFCPDLIHFGDADYVMRADLVFSAIEALP